MKLSVFVPFIGALLVLFVFAACGNGSEEPTEAPTLDAEKQLIVKFVDDTVSDEVREILDRYEAIRIFPDINLGGAWLLQVDAEKRTRIIEELGNHPDVEYAEADVPVELR